MLSTVIASLVTALLSLTPTTYAVKGAVVIPMAQCRFEDGSGPQRFPCVWDADTRGNRKGQSFVLTAPLDQAPAIPVR